MAQTIEATYPQFQNIPSGTDCQVGSYSEAIELGCLWDLVTKHRKLWSLNQLPKDDLVESYLKVIIQLTPVWLCSRDLAHIMTVY